MNRLLIVVAAVLALVSPAHSQWIKDAKVEATIQRGIHATYDMKFSKAQKEFKSVIRSHPRHPAGHFLMAMVDWWKILIDRENESKDAAFLKNLDKVIDLCDDILDKNEKDVSALFFKGGSLGFQGRLHALRKSWVQTAKAGKNALPVVYEAEKLAPGNADIRLGTGIYNYYASILPERYSALKPLMIFLPKGNKGRGIKYLKKAAEKGLYAKYEAQYFLLQTYYGFERKPSVALKYAKSLRKEFPANPVFHRYTGRCYVQLGNWRKAIPVFDEILARNKQKKTGYTKYMEREALYYKGYNAQLHNNHGEAIKYFVKCDRVSRSIDKSKPSGFMIMANLRLGMAHDALKQHKYAKKQYKKVLAMDEYSNSHSLARKYQKSPYR
jgi:tetratricopeptide (TPR) repeat protein